MFTTCLGDVMAFEETRVNVAIAPRTGELLARIAAQTVRSAFDSERGLRTH